MTEALVAAVVEDADEITCDQLRSFMLRKENSSCIEYLRIVMKATFGSAVSAVPISAVVRPPSRRAPECAPVVCLATAQYGQESPEHPAVDASRQSGQGASFCRIPVSDTFGVAVSQNISKPEVNGRARKRGCRTGCSAVGIGVWWILVAIVVGRACLYHQEHSHRDDAGTELSPTVALSIAKGTGFALLVAFPAVYATRLHLIAYCFWTWLHWFSTSTVLHAHIGASIFVAGVVHSVAHFAKAENGAAPLLADAQLQTTLTGCGLLLIVVAMSLPAFRRVSKPAAYVSHSCMPPPTPTHVASPPPSPPPSHPCHGLWRLLFDKFGVTHGSSHLSPPTR